MSLLQNELLIWNKYLLQMHRKINQAIVKEDYRSVVSCLDEMTMAKKVICNILKEDRIRQGRLRMIKLLDDKTNQTYPRLSWLDVTVSEHSLRAVKSTKWTPCPVKE